MADTEEGAKIAGLPVMQVGRKRQRISLLLWGPSGAGKTTLAATTPGKKLLLLFDPDGDASIAEREDVDVVDLTSMPSSRLAQLFKSDTKPLGVDVAALEGYDTVIVDSLTNAQHVSIMYAVTTVKGATVERPSLQGYGTRNALVTQLVKNMLNVTAKAGKHVVFIAHEASPQMNDDGVVMAITVALGGQLANSAPVDFSEVWHLDDTGKNRRIAVRPCRARKPMKTRMFQTSGAPEFEWKHGGTEIADWYGQWRENGWKKIEIPK